MIALLLALLTGSGAVASNAGTIPRVDAVVIVVRNLDAERRFYTSALDFKDLGERAADGKRTDRLALGDQRVELVSYEAGPGAAIASTARSNDRDFQHIAIVVSDMNRAWSHVTRYGVRKVSVAPQVLPAWNPAAGGIAAAYFRDPENHPLELIHYPPGKGASAWHASSPLFLGIDHTAIAVTNTTASTRFYESLGLTVKGHSYNYGIEQERLSGVAGARVQITAVRFADAPGVEFLQYVAPLRPQPRESAAIDDLAATRTRIVEPGAKALCNSLTPVVTSNDGCIARDPDGHLVEIVAPLP
jgi:catechol 2,3-dioxygenase-like lactoylglutathione lyase family enzyme